MSDNIIQFPERKSITELKRGLNGVGTTLDSSYQALRELAQTTEELQHQYQCLLQEYAIRVGIRNIEEEYFENCSYVGYIVNERDEMEITFVPLENSVTLRDDEE
jgi:hypothetical protein